MTYEDYAEIRDRLALTDYKVSQATGISRTTLSAWKKGNYIPKQDKIQKIIDLFKGTKSPALELFSGVGSMTYGEYLLSLIEEEVEVPEYVPGTVEIIDLYSKATPEQRQAVLNLLRSFVGANQT